MAASQFIEACEPKALEFLRDRHDPFTVTALKIRVAYEWNRKARERQWRWAHDTLADPEATEARRDYAEQTISRLKVEAEHDEQGALNGR